MVLGCVLIFLCVLALFRRRMRAKRVKRTAAFAASKNIDARGAGWRAKLFSLFSRGPRISKEEKVALRVARLRNIEEERHMAALGKLGMPSAGTSALPSHYARSRRLSATGGDADSFYSQVTGLPPRAPAPRQPVNMRGIERTPAEVRYSGARLSGVTDAQRYAKSIEERDEPELEQGVGGVTWLTPVGTGTSQGSRNPFRQG